ncbi:nucleotide pyrophosphohydrolase [Candidatus Woesearchaeota archaeon]|nr:nucleotide pyrophosphohydrolase [Candidatus Woesearchaeota archaeon]
MDLHELQQQIKAFNQERDWDQYHNPKDLFVALVSEIGELADCYRWLNAEGIAKIHSDPEKRKKVEEELADIMIYLLILAYKTDIDLLRVAQEKLEKNKLKYPIDKSKGVHSNAIEGYKGVGRL